MPFDGSGNFIPLTLPDYPAVGGQPIFATQFNNVISDLMGGFASVMARNGQSSMTGDLQMGGNKITNIGAAVAAGQALVYGQTAAQLNQLVVADFLQTQALAVNKAAGAVEAFLGVGVTAAGELRAGFNATAGLSSISTPAGQAFIGSPQSTSLAFGLGGALAATLYSGGTFRVANMLQARGAEGARFVHSSSFVSFYNDAETVRTGYLRGITGTGMQLIAEGTNNIQFGVANGTATLASSGAMSFSGQVTAPSFVGPLVGTASAAPWTGITGRPTALSQFTNDLGITGVSSFNARTGAVTLATGDVTTALGFTPIAGITGAQVNAALGYAPYNSTNPAGYLVGISAGMVNAALGFAPYNQSNPAGYLSGLTVSPTSNTFLNADTGNGQYISTVNLVYLGGGAVRLNRTIGFFITGAGPGGGGD